MGRLVLELDDVADLARIEVTEPIRIIAENPVRGGPPLSVLRAALRSKGRLRFSGTRACIFADVDPGPEESSLIALDMIVRSDAKGLERAILSALPQVDQLVIGVDGRSDDETWQVAQAFADIVHRFEASDIGLTDEQWQGNRIHFSNARNIGRAKVTAPWTLIVDSDEYVAECSDLRVAVARAGEISTFGINVRIGDLVQRDRQRLALSRFTWWQESHNQLTIGAVHGEVDATIIHDTSLRSEAEVTRRNGQRDAGIELLYEDAKKGDLPSLFHYIKHRFKDTDPAQLVAWVQDYRFRAEPHGPLAEERGMLAFSLAVLFYNDQKFEEAELWALRALFDGPRVDALCVLGELAENRGELEHALVWYEAACAVPLESAAMRWPDDAQIRVNRRDTLKRAIASAVPKGAVEPGTNDAKSDCDTDVESRS